MLISQILVFCCKIQEAKAKLSEAVEQIKTRDYGNILPKKNELLRIATVFNADPKVRAFTEYQEV